MGAVIDAHRLDPLGTAQERYDLLLTRAARPAAPLGLGPGPAARGRGRRPGPGGVGRGPSRRGRRLCHPRPGLAATELGRGATRTSSTICAGAWEQLPTVDSTDRCRVDARPRRAAVLRPVDRGRGRRARRRRRRPWRAVSAIRRCCAGQRTPRGSLCGRPRHAEQRRDLATEALAAAEVTGDADSQAGRAGAASRGPLSSSATSPGTVPPPRRPSGWPGRAATATRCWHCCSYGSAWPSLSGDAAQCRRWRSELMELRPRRNPEMEAMFVGRRAGDSGPCGTARSDRWSTSSLAARDHAADDDIAASAGAHGRRTHRRAGPGAPGAGPRHCNRSSRTGRSTSDWAVEAEAAALAGDAAAAAAALENLDGPSGRIAISGISTVNGPVDGYRRWRWSRSVAGTRSDRRRRTRGASRPRNGAWSRYLDWLAPAVGGGLGLWLARLPAQSSRACRGLLLGHRAAGRGAARAGTGRPRRPRGPGPMPRISMIWLPSRSGRIAASSSSADSRSMRASRSS